MRPTTAAALALALLTAPLAAQQPAPAPPAPPPAANPADVASVDAILHALYDVISGDSGVARNWDRFRSLFQPGAQLIPVGRRQAGGFGSRRLGVEDYIRLSGPVLETRGFTEREIARRTESYGQIVHAFSTYESRHRASDPTPFDRGINSIQLYNDGTRWWIVNVFWFAESGGAPIPERYLVSELR